MTNGNVFKLAQPWTFTDLLRGVLRDGARTLLVQAVEAEVADFLAKHGDLKTEVGRQRVVRHGHLPEREIGLARSRCASRACVIKRQRMAGASDSRRRSCRPMHGARKASKY